MERSIAVLLSLFLSSASVAQDAFLCVADAMAGFDYNAQQGVWKKAQIGAIGKYLISKSPDFPYEVKAVGSDSPISFCRYGFDRNGYMNCDGASLNISLYKRTGRYIGTRFSGYLFEGEVDQEAPIRDPVAIEIGKCSLIRDPHELD